MSTSPNRIDVHHHLIPPTFAAAMSAKGLSDVAGARLPSWAPGNSISTMDLYGIATAITSLPAPLAHLGGRSDTRDLARSCNEFAADMRARHPDRSGSFASLPMPFTEDVGKEAGYAPNVPHANGTIPLESTE